MKLIEEAIMKLIEEANLDASLNEVLLEIDTLYDKLVKMSEKFSKNHRPVRSQIAMIEQVSDDFKKLAIKLKDIHSAN